MVRQNTYCFTIEHEKEDNAFCSVRLVSNWVKKGYIIAGPASCVTFSVLQVTRKEDKMTFSSKCPPKYLTLNLNNCVKHNLFFPVKAFKERKKLYRFVILSL